MVSRTELNTPTTSNVMNLPSLKPNARNCLIDDEQDFIYQLGEKLLICPITNLEFTMENKLAACE